VIRINEIFGPTIQGEGAAAGRHCLFVRTALCNLECSWCDTPYTWAFTPSKADKHQSGKQYDRAENMLLMETEQVMGELRKLWDIYSKPTIVVISGGEPLLQAGNLSRLCYNLREYNNEVHIETAGTIVPDGHFDGSVSQYNVSPKLENSNNRLEKRHVPEALSFFAQDPRAWWKFVMTSPADFLEIDSIVELYHIPTNRVMVMPEGTTAWQNIDTGRKIINEAKARGWGLTFRSHILLWEDERGK
jgi:organic radical activating enzyme